MDPAQNDNSGSPQSQLFQQIKKQNELLKTQLMSTSMIHELTKVLHTCTNLEGITKTVLLAIQEIIEFDRVILFEIDQKAFCLKPQSWVGISDPLISTVTIPLGFEGGEITDALFLNKHILVEEPDATSDPFSKILLSDTYLVIPLVCKVNKKCWEAKCCNKTTCPAHGSFNPYCWSIPGSGQYSNATNENDRRAACIACSCFKVEGVFWMDRAIHSKTITSDDITILTAIINIAGIVTENFKILNALDKAKNNLQQANEQLKIVNHDLQLAQARIRNDLEHARTIQQGLLPQDLTDTSHFSVGARYLSADAVGGDYYDIFTISPGLYGVIVADVSGHGVASALIMSMAKVLLKTFSTNEPSPQKTLERINETFLSEIKTDHFVTIFYATLDTSNHILRYTSAGHCPVLFIDRTTKKCTTVKADGLFMGVFPDMMLSESSYNYQPGNIRLVLYTDGIVESKNKKDEMYGINKLEDISVTSTTSSPKDSVEIILNDLKDFCGDNSAPEDDITLLVIDL
jgi:serine phosphatase RsbU (regulator of sigma subunit)